MKATGCSARSFRGITLSDRFALDFPGNVMQNGICLGDVDNDGAVELVVGNCEGNLAIFKDDQLWRSRSGLGQISAVCVGDLLNCGRNVVVAVSADGWCSILDLSDKTGCDCQLSTGKCDSVDSAGSIKEQQGEGVLPSVAEASGFLKASSPECAKTFQDASVPQEAKEGAHINLFYRRRIPANIKEMLVFDVNNDGLNELVIALTDRVVRTYLWEVIEGKDGSIKGGLVSQYKWEFGSQVGSITSNRNPDGSNALLVAQPGGALLKLKCNNPRPVDAAPDQPPEVLLSKLGEIMDYEPLEVDKMRNFNVSAEILGGFSAPITSDDMSSPYTLSLLDGTIMFVKNEEVVWTLQTGQQLFCLGRMDITGNGEDEIVVSSWNGYTYFVTQDQSVTEFVFEEPVRTFMCGRYCVNGKNVPVLIYVTFSEKIHVFFNIKIVTGEIDTLLNRQNDEEFFDLMKKLNISDSSVADVNSFLLYGVKSSTCTN